MQIHTKKGNLCAVVVFSPRWFQQYWTKNDHKTRKLLMKQKSKEKNRSSLKIIQQKKKKAICKPKQLLQTHLQVTYFIFTKWIQKSLIHPNIFFFMFFQVKSGTFIYELFQRIWNCFLICPWCICQFEKNLCSLFCYYFYFRIISLNPVACVLYNNVIPPAMCSSP